MRSLVTVSVWQIASIENHLNACFGRVGFDSGDKEEKLLLKTRWHSRCQGGRGWYERESLTGCVIFFVRHAFIFYKAAPSPPPLDLPDRYSRSTFLLFSLLFLAIFSQFSYSSVHPSSFNPNASPLPLTRLSSSLRFSLPLFWLFLHSLIFLSATSFLACYFS